MERYPRSSPGGRPVVQWHLLKHGLSGWELMWINKGGLSLLYNS